MGRGIEDLPGSAGEVDRAKVLWSRLRNKVEGKPSASEAAQDVAKNPEDPDARAVLRVQLRKLLEGEGVLAAEVASLLDSDGAALTAAVVNGSGTIVQGSGAVAAGAGEIAVGRDIVSVGFHTKGRD
jgi:hypothetical protein